MQDQLFSWDGIDILDTMCFQFYDCTLKVRIGRFEAGSQFNCITIDYGEGKLQLYKNGENGYWEHNLSLNIVNNNDNGKFIVQE